MNALGLLLRCTYTSTAANCSSSKPCCSKLTPLAPSPNPTSLAAACVAAAVAAAAAAPVAAAVAAQDSSRGLGSPYSSQQPQRPPANLKTITLHPLAACCCCLLLRKPLAAAAAATTAAAAAAASVPFSVAFGFRLCCWQSIAGCCCCISSSSSSNSSSSSSNSYCCCCCCTFCV